MEELLRKLRESIDSRIESIEKEHKPPVEKLTEENFEKEIRRAPIAVVLFTAPWCQPCKAFEPLFEIVARKLVNDERYRGKLVFGILDTDAYPHVADKYQVDKIPTIIIYYNGNVADVIVGATTEETLVRKITDIISKSS